ncbi:MAG: superoxide dismutase [Sulfuricurvum sp.]|uniref:superoxide dismutase n=1 Tax=Sulfuricurvum sp. TaxID=2025608 RepID=UPI0026189418|nr:superoxide dismutase [Sulfuricurvum sp.]MDD2838584.1 superoxide dismutase [Sulfuricurvum sp.]MDD3595918.1 superoxide dismutase [Sulfuricurvum sp.]
MQHQLMALPYEHSALEPYISAETLSYHYDKHHAGYVNKLNSLIEGTEFVDAELETIILKASGAVFNNAAQVYNHDFYWKGLKPGKSELSKELADRIDAAFGSLESLKEQFLSIAAGFFGSGWIWLVLTPEGELKIETTSNADTPIRHGQKPLLTCDVWEHAYYIDYRNARPNYLSNWWPLINWEFVSENFAAAKRG